jgi:tetratricopeptide (TPR) repeat protein
VLYRSYLWMSGLPAVLPALTARLAPRGRYAALALICAALVLPARDRIATFADPFLLWDDAVRKNTDPGAPYAERAYINRGELHREAGNATAALADYDHAIALNPRATEAYADRATLRLEMGEPQRALADLERALALNPRHASVHAKRCYAKQRLGRPAAEAIADCDAARALDRGDPEIRRIDQAVRRAYGMPLESRR